jgi:hypothetical protein
MLKQRKLKHPGTHPSPLSIAADSLNVMRHSADSPMDPTVDLNVMISPSGPMVTSPHGSSGHPVFPMVTSPQVSSGHSVLSGPLGWLDGIS